MIMAKSIRSLALAALAATGLAVSAQAADTTGVTDTTIKIGIPGPMTGPNSSFGAAVYGVQSIYRYYNDQGGVNGRKFDVIIGDTACNEAKGVAVAKKLISQDKVFLINGGVCSGVALAMKPVIAEASVPWVVSTAANQNISSPVVPTIFHAIQTSLNVGVSMAKFALSKPGTKKIAIIEHTNEWSKGYRDPAVEYLKSKGLEPVAEVTLERGQTDATSQVLKLKEVKPDFILAILYEPELAIFLRDAHKYALGVPMVGSLGAGFQSTQNRLGGPDAMKGFYMGFQYKALTDGPRMKKWHDIIAKYLPQGEKLTDFSFYGAGSAIAVVHVLQSLGKDVTRERFVEAMNKLHNFDTKILAGTLNFSPTDHLGARDLYTIGYDDAGKLSVYSAWGKKAE
jgi:branched-chain amino acid transport system substrate-binding protein